MIRSILSLLPLLALARPALAADLDLDLRFDGLAPVNLTFHDVVPGQLPGVDLPGVGGKSVRVDFNLAESSVDGAPAYDLAITMTQRTAAGRKRVHEEVYRPTLRFLPNQEAVVTVGGQRPIADTDPVQWEEVVNYRIEALVRTETAVP